MEGVCNLADDLARVHVLQASSPVVGGFNGPLCRVVAQMLGRIWLFVSCLVESICRLKVFPEGLEGFSCRLVAGAASGRVWAPAATLALVHPPPSACGIQVRGVAFPNCAPPAFVGALLNRFGRVYLLRMSCAFHLHHSNLR